MKNPKSWAGATPWSHRGKVDKSGPDKNLSAHGRPDVRATGMDMQGPTPRSGEGYKSLGHGGTDMGMPYPMSSDRSEMGASFAKPGTIKKSKPEKPADPVKWHKKGYDMVVPATEAEATPITKKMKAH